MEIDDEESKGDEEAQFQLDDSDDDDLDNFGSGTK